MVTRILPSAPGFAHINDLADQLAMMTSPACHFNLASAEDEIPEAERRACVEYARERLRLALETHRVCEALRTVAAIREWRAVA